MLLSCHDKLPDLVWFFLFCHQLLSMFHLTTTAFWGSLMVERVCSIMYSILKCNHFTSMSFGSRYSRMDQVRFFKGWLPQILLDPFLNTLTLLLFPEMQTCHMLPLNASVFYQYHSTRCCQKSFLSCSFLVFWNSVAFLSWTRSNHCHSQYLYQL